MPDENDPKLEPGELSRYMDSESDDGITDEKFADYLRIRYEQILQEYQQLKMQLREAEGAKRDDIKDRLRHVLEQNYKSRKYVVRELRKRGVEIKDQFIVN
jgi:hypothetical protein